MRSARFSAAPLFVSRLLPLLGLSLAFVAPACGNDDGRTDYDDGTPDGDAADAGGGPGSGGSGTGGSSGQDGGAGGDGGGDGDPTDDEFAGLLVILDEFESAEETMYTEAGAVFLAPGSDVSEIEDSWDDYLAGLATLAPGACGPRPNAATPLVEPVGVGLPTLASSTDNLHLSQLIDGIAKGFAEEADTVGLRATPLDFSIGGGESVAAATVAGWGEIPEFVLNSSYDCPAADGCTITPDDTDADDLLIEFNTSQGWMLCRSGTGGQNVTIPPNLLDQDTNGILYVFHFHDVQLGSSPLRIVVESRLEPVPLYGSEPL